MYRNCYISTVNSIAMKIVLFVGLMMGGGMLSCQRLDSLVTDSVTGKKVMAYQFKDKWLLYPKPKFFNFLTQAPRTFQHSAIESFSKKSVPAWVAIAWSTSVLAMRDQAMLESVQQFSRFIKLDNSRIYHDVLDFKIGKQEVTIYEAPGNLNTFFYQIGEGLPPLLLGAGLAIYGHVNHDYRARSTANQLVQTFVVMGIGTQVMKRMFGRESPFVATADGGAWRPFPNLKTYQNSVSKYDAMPSGHMATLMATVVVLSGNYPEKRWIKPVGYSVMSLVGLAMMNNGVHWAGDYPLAIGLGYVVGNVTVKMNRWVRGK